MEAKLEYELSHDMLAQQVFQRFSEEEKALRRAERLLHDSYEIHTEVEGGRLLTQVEIGYLGPFLHLLKPEGEIASYLDESIAAVQAAEQAERRRLQAEIDRQIKEKKRQRRRFRVSLVVGFAMVVVAGFAVYNFFELKAEQVNRSLSDAQTAIERKDFPEAESHIERALKLNPSHVEAKSLQDSVIVLKEKQASHREFIDEGNRRYAQAKGIKNPQKDSTEKKIELLRQSLSAYEKALRVNFEPDTVILVLTSLQNDLKQLKNKLAERIEDYRQYALMGKNPFERLEEKIDSLKKDVTNLIHNRKQEGSFNANLP